MVIMKRAIELFLILMVIGQIALFSQVQEQSRETAVQNSIVQKHDLKEFTFNKFLNPSRY
tara:strand:+ start:334 stop:513 length:180 start_codon:yes stop_codon:yes gene_type:complete